MESQFSDCECLLVCSSVSSCGKRGDSKHLGLPSKPSSSSLTVSHLTLAETRQRTMCARGSSGGGQRATTRRAMPKHTATPSLSARTPERCDVASRMPHCHVCPCRLSGRTPRCDVACLMPAPTRACPVSSAASCEGGPRHVLRCSFGSSCLGSDCARGPTTATQTPLSFLGT
jgi:hypothetical protein